MSKCETCKNVAIKYDEKPCKNCSENSYAKRYATMTYFNYEERKPTNYEKIMSEMTPDKLAELMVEHDWQYDDCGVITTYKTSFEDRWYYSQEENAIDDQLEWLKSEVECE